MNPAMHGANPIGSDMGRERLGAAMSEMTAL